MWEVAAKRARKGRKFKIKLMEIITTDLLNSLTDKALKNDRLRINYNFHKDLSDKCQRLLNAMEPGTVMPIHHHKVAEMYIVLRGRLKTNIYDDNKNIVESCIIDPKEGNFGVQIEENKWHSVEVLEHGTVIFEVKEGQYIPHETGGILE